jgi:PAS domain S-box-containing protein
MKGAWMVSTPTDELARKIDHLQQQAERLKSRQQLSLSIVEAFEGLVYVCSPDYRIQFMNQALIARTGYDGTGDLCYRVLHERDSVCPWCVNQRVFQGQTVRWEVQSPKDNRWYDIVNKPMVLPGGTLSKHAVIIDITDQKIREQEIHTVKNQLERLIEWRRSAALRMKEGLRSQIQARRKTEAAFRESENRFKELANSLPHAVFETDQKGLLTFSNRNASEMFGYSRDEFQNGQNALDMIVAEDRQRAMEDFGKVMAGTELGGVAYRAVRKDGSTFPVQVNASPILQDGRPLGVRGILIDLTQIKRAEDRIHSLTHQLIRAQEDERLRISRDLHDHVAQQLSSLKIGLQKLFFDQPQILQSADETHCDFLSILEQSIAAVRNLSYQLRPPGLDQLGLEKTVSSYCNDFSEIHPVKVRFFSAGMDNLFLEFDTMINLYRVVQEALTNIGKHARAKTVTVRLVASHPNLILRIEDDGQGFDLENRMELALKEKRLGLQGMTERIHLLGGTLKIRSTIGKGTEIVAEVPIREKP